MRTVLKESDFDDLSWHDCHIWALELRAGDPEQGDWTSDLALDIDFIVDWVCGTDGGGQFRVAPATLVFRGVTDLRVAVDWGASNFQVALHPASIDGITREQIHDSKVYLDRTYYRWKIGLNWPAGGEITFGASGFTQTLRADPVLTERQHLTLRERTRPAQP